MNFKKYISLAIVAFTLFQMGCAHKINRSGEKRDENPSSAAGNVAANDGAEANQNFHMKLWGSGEDFYARGNEPNWSLDLDFEEQTIFRASDGMEMTVSSLKGETALDDLVTRYIAEEKTGSIIITMLEDSCTDTMSDYLFTHKVRIEVKYKKDYEYTQYGGCGQFVPDYSLHDIWALVAVDDTKVSNNANRPTIEFHVEEGKVIGSTGCNEFNGAFTIMGIGEIQFGQMAMTKKLCSDTHTENVMIKSLFGRRMKYYKEGLHLYLEGFDGTKFLFRKVD